MMIELDPSAWPADFEGRVNLYALPNLVMFPHVLQPLHVHESRHLEILSDSLRDDQLLATALLQPGWERQYEGCPPIFPVTCLCRVVASVRLTDGSHNVLLLGLRRAAVVRELRSARPRRAAEVALLEDLYPSRGALRRRVLQKQLLDRFRAIAPASHWSHAGRQVSLGVLSDVAAFSLQLSTLPKQQLLTEWNVDKRAGLLVKQIDLLLAKQADAPLFGPEFPPDFSPN